MSIDSDNNYRIRFVSYYHEDLEPKVWGTTRPIPFREKNTPYNDT